MNLNEYQEKAMATCTPSSHNQLYMLFGLCEEVGELQGKIAKAIRKGMLTTNMQNCFMSTDEGFDKTDALVEDIKKELGDVAWMLAGVCSVHDWSLEEICQMNLDKLADRQKRNVIVGEGDNR